MTTVDSFSYGKKGRRLTEHAAMVKRIKTWHHKTVLAKVLEVGLDWRHYKTDHELFDDLATVILERANKPRIAPL